MSTTAAADDDSYKCSDGTVISALRIQDGVRDCGDGGDEKKKEEEEEQQTIEQEAKEFLKMIEDPYEAAAAIEKEEDDEYIGGEKEEEEKEEEESVDLEKTLLSMRGENVLSGIPSDTIRYNIIFR